MYVCIIYYVYNYIPCLFINSKLLNEETPFILSM